MRPFRFPTKDRLPAVYRPGLARPWFIALIMILALASACCSARPHGTAAPTASPSAGAATTPTGTATPGAGTATPGPATPTPGRTTGSPRATGTRLPANLLGRDIEVIPTSRRVVALTFDGGADAGGVTSILGTLAAHRVTASFFLTGQFATRYPDTVHTIAGMGYRIGNHSATHPHLRGKSDAEVRAQLTTAESQLRAAGAPDPHPLFRFPYGECDAHTIAAVNAAGYLSVRWTVDSLGWEGLRGRPTDQAVRELVDRVVGAARPGAIVLMHLGANPDDGSLLDAAALPTIIDRLSGMGYSFVTLDALTRG